MSHKLYKHFEGKLKRAGELPKWEDQVTRLRSAIEHEYAEGQLTEGESNSLTLQADKIAADRKAAA